MEEPVPLSPVRYAVVLQDGDGAPVPGALTVVDGHVVFSGNRSSAPVELRLSPDELVEIRVGRGSAERLKGYPTVVVERVAARPVLIAPLGISLVHEIANLLASLTASGAESTDQIELLVPLKPGCRERARRLIGDGPPFDPAELGLRSHSVLLGDDHVIFVFEGAQVRRTLEHTLAQPSLWRAGLAWRGCIAGRPRILEAGERRPAISRELVYSWPRQARKAPVATHKSV